MTQEPKPVYQKLSEEEERKLGYVLVTVADIKILTDVTEQECIRKAKELLLKTGNQRLVIYKPSKILDIERI